MLVADAMGALTGLTIAAPQHSPPFQLPTLPGLPLGAFSCLGIHSRCEGLGNSQRHPYPHPRTGALVVAGCLPFSVSFTQSPTGISCDRLPINNTFRYMNPCIGLDFRVTPSKAVIRVLMGLSIGPQLAQLHLSPSALYNPGLTPRL